MGPSKARHTRQGAPRRSATLRQIPEKRDESVAIGEGGALALRSQKHRRMSSIDVVGWLASACLLLTIGTQVRRQWQSGDASGVSIWLYVGQIVASITFVVYSALVDNMVFVVTNTAMAMAASLGLYLFLRSSSDEEDEQRDTLPTIGQPVAVATVTAEPGNPRIVEEATRDLLSPGGGPSAIDVPSLVVSPRDTIGTDPIHRHAD
jgi:MtN3 and saliva related transmembrane protein